jgi:cation diffusion facilitator CzcD-associated flavoprotein CzcO
MVSAQGATLVLRNQRRVAVVSAGVSGLAAVKCLLEKSMEPVVYERAGTIGGLWSYNEALPDGGGVMYRSLHTNTPPSRRWLSLISLWRRPSPTSPTTRKSWSTSAWEHSTPVLSLPGEPRRSDYRHR